MKVLILCAHGKNRSRYLKQYLADKGYDSESAGVINDSAEDVQKKIAAADVVVTVHDVVREQLSGLFDLSDKRIIDIDVEDRPEQVLPEGRQLDGDEWVAFQEEHVYPKLREHIDRHLPL